MVPKTALGPSTPGNIRQDGGHASDQSRSSSYKAQYAAEVLHRCLILDSQDFLAINKPAGLAVQGGTNVDISIDSLLSLAFPEIEFAGRRRSGEDRWLRLAHRLDKSASGVLLIGKGADATAKLAEAFREKSDSAIRKIGDHPLKDSNQRRNVSDFNRKVNSNLSKIGRNGRSTSEFGNKKGGGGGTAYSAVQLPEVEKLYWAVVCKESDRDLDNFRGRIHGGVQNMFTESLFNKNLELRRGKKGSIEAAVGPPGAARAARGIGDPALTHYRVLESNGPLAWLELEPVTGRKHQLRQHCAWELGSSILGDHRYGAIRKDPQKSILRNLFSNPNSIDSLNNSGKGKERSIGRGDMPLLLHCREMVVKLPGEKVVKAVAPVPEVWKRLFEGQGWRLPRDK